jgi:hypothetical protein
LKSGEVLAEEFRIHYYISVLYEFISKVRIEFYEVQQCFFNNKIEPLHVLANDGRHLILLI